jgi:hypothetical protein
MRQYESCEEACRKRRLELVNGGDYDELTAAAAACRVRIEGLWAVVGNWRAESQAWASGGSGARRFSSLRVQRCDVSGPQLGAAMMSCFHLLRP